MRILVVEDDQLLNKTLSYNLSAVGYSVDGAMSKAVAIRFLEKQDYDLIVLDVNLPDGNGFDICREVKERRPDTAVIFLTANDMESDMLKGFELGADDYVTKPFPISVFQKKVSALLNRISAQSGGDFYDDGNMYFNFSKLSACLPGRYCLKSCGMQMKIKWMNTHLPQRSAASAVKLKRTSIPTSKPFTVWAICGLEERKNDFKKTLLK